MPILPAWLGNAAFGAAILFALWKGGPTERWAGAAMLAAWTLTLLGRAAGLSLGVIADLALFAFLAGLALRSHRFWPIWAAGFHLLAIMTHAARSVDAKLIFWTYSTAGIFWNYLVIVALVVGTYGAWREQRQLAKAGVVAEPGATLR